MISVSDTSQSYSIVMESAYNYVSEKLFFGYPKVVKNIIMGWQGGLLLEWPQLTEFQELEGHTRW